MECGPDNQHSGFYNEETDRHMDNVTRFRNDKNMMKQQDAYVEPSGDLTVPQEVLAAKIAPDQVGLQHKPWYFDSITKQSVLELLQETGQVGDFIIRESDTLGHYALSWIAPD